MRALLIDGYAPVPSAHLGTAADVRPGPGEVRIRVEAAALNPLAAKLAQGDMTGWFPLAFPYVPGTDFAGVVDALGEDVTDLHLGEPVLGRSEPVVGGALAEAIIVHARSVSLEGYARMTLLGRLGQPDDSAGVVAFLAGPEASWVTGQVIPANGGMA